VFAGVGGSTSRPGGHTRGRYEQGVIGTATSPRWAAVYHGSVIGTVLGSATTGPPGSGNAGGNGRESAGHRY
jgi:hypothetical protein